MTDALPLQDKLVLITGAAKRVGRSLALACARAGAHVAVHYGQSQAEAESLRDEIRALGRQAWLIQADLGDPQQAVEVIERAAVNGPLYALVNNASIFDPLTWQTATLEDWNRNLMVNLTAPFLLSQAFATRLLADPAAQGRIVNLLDWRALRPGVDHLPYTIAKAGLAALTRSLGVSLAPRITVNGLALGAILPPSGSMPAAGNPDAQKLIAQVPAGRWAELEEVDQALLFLLAGPAYITGEILHIDGGRHLK
ncbi:MAG TPA: SDR family oxidoreductase [Anaerolinea sp.]|nr:SDR family oxidoreductase [Anaerolinea sp.]